MKVAFFVNDVATEEAEYTTTRLAMATAKLEHEVWYVAVGDVGYHTDETMHAKGHRAVHVQGDELEPFLSRAKEEERCAGVVLDDFDAVWLRNDTMEDMQDRPWAANVGVVFGQMLAARGVTVVNDPTGLSRAGSKLYLQEFPAEIRPRCIVTRNAEEIREFVAETGHTVVKPLYGAKGKNVFMIDGKDDPNLAQMVEAVLLEGYAIAQEFVTGGEEGDLRLFLLDGELMQVNGAYAAVRRVPQGNDLRANISAGAKPEEANIGESELAVVRALKDRLVADGMFFVGIDLIGDKVVEINAESPGGLQSVEHFTGVDFGITVSEALERRAGSWPAAARRKVS